MKNVFIITLLVIVMFVLVFGAYLLAFKLYFNSDKLSRHAKRMVRMTFQRESSVSSINLSPFGSFKVNSFAMSAKGGFNAGTTFSMETAAVKLDILRLFRRELIIDDFKLSNVHVNLNYEKRRKFNYAIFFSNMRFVFMKSSARQGLIRKLVIDSMLVENSSVDVKLDIGILKFKNIMLASGAYGEERFIDGRLSFVFEFAGFEANVTCDLEYDKENKSVAVKNLYAEELSLSADGRINFLENGAVEFEYDAKVNKEKLSDFFKAITGVSMPLTLNNSGDDGMDEAMLHYSNINKVAA